MKRHLTLVCLCMGLASHGQEVSSTNELAQLRPIYRCLFLIDTSSAMSRQKTLTMDTVSRLILSGISGRLHPGDAWRIWTFDDQLHTNLFPSQTWDPAQRREVANHAYRFLRDQRFKKKKGHLDKPLALIADEAKLSGELTVFLFTDGSEPVKGTPFDGPVNQIFKQHAAGMQKAKKPFVTVYVAQEGQFVAHAVSPAGEPIYIPRAAKKTEKESNASSTQAKSGTKPEATVAENVTPAQSPPPKKPLTVSEISEALRQSEKQQTNTIAATPAPLIIRGTNSAAANEAAKPNAPNPAPTPDAPPLVAAGTNASEKHPASAPNTSSTNAPAGTPGPGGNAPAEKDAAPPAETIVPPEPQKAHGGIATADTLVNDTGDARVPASGSPQSAAILQSERGSNAWKFLASAAALLLVALTSAWLYIRSIRYVPRPSLISRSMEKEKK